MPLLFKLIKLILKEMQVKIQLKLLPIRINMQKKIRRLIRI